MKLITHYISNKSNWDHKSSGGPRLTNNFSNADVD